MPDDRPFPGRPPDRPPFNGPRPFRPNPRLETPPAPIPHTLRLRDGEREIEVSGSAVFVRQVLDDIPSMWARLQGEAPARPARIDLPSPRPVEVAHPVEPPTPAAGNVTPVVNGNAAAGVRAPAGTIDERVLAVLEASPRPLAVAAIRKRLGGSVTPQQVRRILERNTPRVSVTDDRPATYRLR